MAIAAATAMAERYTGARFVTQTVESTWEAFCEDVGVYPVNSITSVQYYDADNSLQPFTAYTRNLVGLYPLIRPTDVWPQVYDRPDAVKYTLVVGNDAADVPSDVKAAILLRVSTLFDSPGEESSMEMTPNVLAFEALLRPHRRFTL
jgi:uncharacterized phiE125 gp8 family phage protein